MSQRSTVACSWEMSLFSSLLLHRPTTCSIEGHRTELSLLQPITNQIGGRESAGGKARARFPVILLCGSSTFIPFIFLLFLVDTTNITMFMNLTSIHVNAQALLPVINAAQTDTVRSLSEGIWAMGAVTVLTMPLFASHIAKGTNTVRGAA